MHDSRRTRLVLSVLLIAAIALITLDFKDGGTSPVRRTGADIFGPVERIAHTVTNPVTSVFDSITGGPSAQSTIADLQRQNAELRAQLSAAQLSKADQAQLNQMLRLAGRGGYRIIPASVIAAGGEFSDSVTLDVGSNDGVKPNETVLNGSGLVGTVTDVSSDTSTVLLATDASSVVGVRLAGSNEIGEITGTGKSMAGPGMLRLTLFDASTVLQPGQQLVTFGSVGNQPYVPGVPVGTVASVSSSASSLTQAALIRPFADFTTLGVVGVVVEGPRQDPRDSVLPRPAPKVTVTVTARPTASPANPATNPAANPAPSAGG
ncbi:MAG TPA: rod shape-determining protein MreC [Streptosporangiaceae bacterium]